MGLIIPGEVVNVSPKPSNGPVAHAPLGTLSCGAAVALDVWSLCQGSSPPRYEVFALLDAPMDFPPQGLLCCSWPQAGTKAEGVCAALPYSVLPGCVGEQASDTIECLGCALAVGGVWQQHWHPGRSAPAGALSPQLVRNSVFLLGSPTDRRSGSGCRQQIKTGDLLFCPWLCQHLFCGCR